MPEVTVMNDKRASDKGKRRNKLLASILMLVVAAILLLFLTPIHRYPLSLLVMRVSNMINFSKSIEKDTGIRLHIPGGGATAERDWYPFVMNFTADSLFDSYTGHDGGRLSIYYNFAAFDIFKGCSDIYEPTSPYYSSFYGAYIVRNHDGSPYGFISTSDSSTNIGTGVASDVLSVTMAGTASDATSRMETSVVLDLSSNLKTGEASDGLPQLPSDDAPNRQSDDPSTDSYDSYSGNMIYADALYPDGLCADYDSIAGITQLDYSYLVLSDIGLSPSEQTFDLAITGTRMEDNFAGFDGWIFLEADMTVNGMAHTALSSHPSSYLQYGVPSEHVETAFEPVNMHGIICGRHFAEKDVSIFFYVMSPDVSVCQSCTESILRHSKIKFGK
ncbi:MAG: hypothetical protein J6Y90_01190 [Lachnospiraceae bacterium]|nr:hypothetical protein [Lachnospiraceae bacterium]